MAAVITLGAVAISFWLGQRAVDTLQNSVAPLTTSTITVSEQATSVFVDADQVAESVSCTGKPVGSPAVDLTQPDTDLKVQIDGRRWDRVATTKGMVTADYTLACVTESGAVVDISALGVSTDTQIGNTLVTIVLAFVIPVVTAVVAAAMVLIVFYRRRKAAVRH